ncbi:MAG: DUF962 domain-containing protein [Isosphaeraceae bacterium]
MSTLTPTPPATETTAPAPSGRAMSRFERLVATYHEDHKHPINHVLHVWVGWPICAFGVLVFPFRPWWTLGAFVLGYAFMWTGHFLFEKNLPTVFQHPTTPFVMAWAVVRGLLTGGWRLVTGRRSTSA